MNILDYLPEFKIIEIRRSTGLVIGHVLSQNLADTGVTTEVFGDGEFIENGTIVGLSNNRKIDNFELEEHNMPFVVFNEEINTFLNGLKYYAQEVETETYPRAIGLYPGDAFVTNNYSGVLGATTKYAKVVDGVLTLQTSADDYTMFAVEQSTLPVGGAAGLFVYLGINQGQISEI
jgi:hypothetical protein